MNFLLFKSNRFLIYVKPVSYTHLDVYKRQVYTYVSVSLSLSVSISLYLFLYRGMTVPIRISYLHRVLMTETFL